MSKALIKSCKKNDSKSQRLLLEQYAGYTMGVIKRYCSDTDEMSDILQETWISIFKSISNYEEQGSFKSWIAKIAVRQCFKQNRRRNYTQPIDDVSDIMMIEGDALDQLGYMDLMKIVDQLPMPSRDVFKMYVIEGFSHKEISEILQMAESTSRVHLSNARKKLKESLHQMEI